MVKILIKKLDQSVIIPEYKTKGASGMDLTANVKEPFFIEPGKSDIVPTGISLLIPNGYEVQIRPRSGLAAKKKISVLNTPGTIDSDYRGEIKVILTNLGDKAFVVEKGLRIAQMVLCPVVQARIDEVENLNKTDRGSGGFGSTGTK